MGRLSGKAGSKATGATAKGVKEIMPTPISMIKDAFAANDAHRTNEEIQDAEDAKHGKVHGAVYQAFESAGDAVMDVANVVTLGAARRVGNVVEHALHDDASTVDYAALKAQKKSGQINLTSDIGDRASALLNENVKATQFADETPQPAVSAKKGKTSLSDRLKDRIFGDSEEEVEAAPTEDVEAEI